MDDIFQTERIETPEGFADPETARAAMEQMVQTALQEAGGAAEMNADDTSWLEGLFRRIVDPITDVLDGSKDGIETETLSPYPSGNLETDEGMEAAEAHQIDEAMETWHVQDGDFSCAVCVQQFIINEFTGQHLSEQELCTLAEENGWFDPESGTSPKDVGNLLELYGIDTQVNYEGSISDIKNTLDQGGRVIVGVDSMVLWVDGFGNYPICGTDHAIEIIDIDDSDPLDVRVIINDSGSGNGCGRSVPYLDFMEAWTPSGGFMVSAFPKD